MESLENGGRVVERGQVGSSIRQRLRRRLDHLFRVSLIGLLCLMQLAWGITYAQSTRYVYDANGRVVAVTASNGTSVQYSYNALGHASQISAPVPSGQLAIFTFVPTHGQAGTQVTIQGQGFDSNAANDTVSFNGAVATVLSAAATQLVVAVPSGATTGPISVSVGSQTASSATPFVVDDTGVPPIITQVSPAVVSIGGTVTVAGAHLAPTGGDTVVQMGERGITTLAAVSDAQLQYVVPSNGTSGFVTIATPYGSAISPTPVIVLPSGISASSVVSIGNAAVDGNDINLNIGASGQFGVVTVVAPQSGWVSLQASGITTSASSINYTVYAPGNSVVQQGTISSSSPSIHLPYLAAGAVYAVFIQPNGGGAQLTLKAESNASLMLNAEATAATSLPGQSKRLVFQAAANQALTVFVDSTSTNPAGQSVSYTIYNVAQQSVLSGSVSGSGTIGVPVTSAGTYQIVVNPGGSVTGTVQMHLGQGNVLPANGQVGLQGGLPIGRSENFNFTANAGDNLELTISNLSVASSPYSPVKINVLDPNGTNVASGQCYDANVAANTSRVSSCRLALWNLVQGMYTVVVTPPDSGSTLNSFNVVLQPDTIGPALSLNTAATATLALGQVERMTFSGNAGDNLALLIANVSTTNLTSQPVTFAVYRPDGAILTTNAFLTDAFTSGGTFDLTNLPVSGTYTVVIATFGEPGTAQLTLTQRTIASNGQSGTYGGYLVGQNAGINFTANAGDNLELTISNLSVASSPYSAVKVNVLDPNGTNVASLSGQCYDAVYAANTGRLPSCRLPLWNLVQGTYTIVISPPDSGSTINSFNATLQPDTIGPAMGLNTTTTTTLGPGQVERVTFSANAGDNMALMIAGISTSNPAGQPVQFQVYRPDLSITASSAYVNGQSATSATVNLTDLPAAGTYTVVVSTGGEAGTAQITPRLADASGNPIIPQQ